MESRLTGAEIRALRAQGQLLADALRVGRDGASGPVVQELDRLLRALQLVKVRFMDADRTERATLAIALAGQTQSTCVGAVGHTALFYRPTAEEQDG